MTMRFVFTVFSFIVCTVGVLSACTSNSGAAFANAATVGGASAGSAADANASGGAAAGVPAAKDQVRITSYEECIAAGRPMLKSYPPKCVAPDGTVFTQKLPERKIP